MQTSSDSNEEDIIQPSKLPKEEVRRTSNEFNVKNNQTCIEKDKIQTSNEAKEDKMQMSNESTEEVIQARAGSKEKKKEISTVLKEQKVRTSSELKQDSEPLHLSKKAAETMEGKSEPREEMSSKRSARSDRPAR